MAYDDCLSGTWLASRLGIEPAAVDRMRRGGELIGVRRVSSGEWLYPAWQLHGDLPRAAVPRIVDAAREAGLNEERLYEVLTLPMGLAGERRRLADALVAGADDEVVAAVRGSRPA